MPTYTALLLSMPADTAKQANYATLSALWDEYRGGRMTAERFTSWDAEVQKSLNEKERAFFTAPYQGDSDPVLIEVGRVNHLTKILLARHGIVAAEDREKIA